MATVNFNPVNFIVSMAVGWFFMSFLQSAFRSLVARNWDGLVSRFRTIAFFHDGTAALINILVIVAIGILTTSLWNLAHRG